jgi:sulfate adenylyltransferase subunit 1
VQNDINLSKARFPVQYVIRPQTDALHDYRGYAGKVISGIYRVGDQVVVQPSGLKTKITGLETNGKQTNEAFAPQSVVMLLEDDIDISRGDVIVKNDDSTRIENEFQAYICWMDNKPLVPGNKYLLQLNSRRVRSIVKEIEFKLDVNTLQKNPSPAHAELNDVIKATIKTATPLPHDSYAELRQNGGAILIDETSNVTVGACMIQ